jgi:hypothetical protein
MIAAQLVATNARPLVIPVLIAGAGDRASTILMWLECPALGVQSVWLEEIGRMPKYFRLVLLGLVGAAVTSA